MTAISQRLAIVGCGTMGDAIVSGLLRAGAIAPERITATVRRREVAAELRTRHGIAATTDNVAACRDADVVLFALKPQRLPKIATTPAVREALLGKTVISIAAGVTLAQLGAWLPGSGIIRAMPNTPCLIGEGMTVVPAAPRSATPRSPSPPASSRPSASASSSRTNTSTRSPALAAAAPPSSTSCLSRSPTAA